MVSVIHACIKTYQVRYAPTVYLSDGGKRFGPLHIVPETGGPTKVVVQISPTCSILLCDGRLQHMAWWLAFSHTPGTTNSYCGCLGYGLLSGYSYFGITLSTHTQDILITHRLEKPYDGLYGPLNDHLPIIDED